jgi:hypothetical protein
MAQQLKDPKEKISYYRQAAEEAERSASRTTDTQTREGFLAVMRTWIYLADELEREIATDERPGPDHEEIVIPPQDGDGRDSHTTGLRPTNKSRL